MTTIGDILDEFFSPVSQERLWVMPESDGYTVLVRTWQPVIDAMRLTKENLVRNSTSWSTQFLTNPSWLPVKSDAPKHGAYRQFMPSPPGTDPETCKKAFIIYAGSKAAKVVTLPILPVPVLPDIQTRNLYTCSIGSFNIYTTLDAVDVAAKTATLDYWMYNSMSKHSFGRFASRPEFALCGMATQYM